MKTYNIEKNILDITNNGIFWLIKDILAQKIEGLPKFGLYRLLMISDLVKNISNETLLGNTLDLFSECNICRKKEIENISLEINLLTNRNFSSKEKCLRAKAIILSDFLAYKILLQTIPTNTYHRIEPYQFEISKNTVETNIDNFERIPIKEAVIQATEALPYDSKKTLLDEMLKDRYRNQSSPYSLEDVNYLKEQLQLCLPSVINNKMDLTNRTDGGYTITPHLKKEIIGPLFTILKDFIDEEQHDSFKSLLQTLGQVESKIIFLSNGNRLSDVFKKLVENEMIIGWHKKDLIKWIAENFCYLKNGSVSEYKVKSIELVISGNQTPCKNPIIDIEEGIIKKTSR